MARPPAVRAGVQSKPKLTKPQAQEALISAIAKGATIVAACEMVGRTLKAYENWRSTDKDFAVRVDQVRASRISASKRDIQAENSSLSFAEWRKKFMGQDTYRHQQAWCDLLEKGTYNPAPGETYVPANPNRIIINVPPFHAKSMCMSIEYPVYRICMDPNVRIIIVSKRQDQARKFLYAIKQRLTSSQWAPMQAAYAPNGTFRPERSDGGTWGADKIYVAGVDSGEKDPTVEAIGIGGQVYGSRADLIIMDDTVVISNAAQYEAQIQWLESEVESRAYDGKILIIGTRLATTDLYSELPSGDRYLSGKSPWTVLRQPAVLQYADKPEDWVTLWPRTTRPMDSGQQPAEDGTYEAWPGPRLARLRDAKPSRVWSLVYMQQDVADDSTFNPTCVMGSVNRLRKPGPLKAGGWGHPRNGAEGMQVIMSWDPAGTGEAFVLIYAVDKATKKRYVLNAWGERNTTPAWYAGVLEANASLYGVKHLVIEQNAYASWLIHDDRIVTFCRENGIRMLPHYTGRNKQDPDFGVPSLAPLLGGVRRIVDGGRQDHDKTNMVEFPDPDLSPGVKALLEQLISWQPGKLGRQLRMDGPMAWWFAELAARSILGTGQTGKIENFMNNPYLSKADQARRVVIPLDGYLDRAI